MFASLDRHYHLLEAPLIRSELRAETRHTVPHRFVGSRDPARCQQIVDVAKIESKTMMGPDCVADDRARKPETFKRERSDRFHTAPKYNAKTAPTT